MPRGYCNERPLVHCFRYNLIWSPKYRKKALTDKVARLLESLIEEEVDEQNLEISELAIQPNHVHLFLSGHQKLSPSTIIRLIKGYSSRVIRGEYDFDLPSLWTRSYFVATAGEVSSQVIEEYIETQIGE